MQRKKNRPEGRIAACTYGCKINQYETACIINQFINAGWQQVNFSQPADLYLINTCTVTNRTDYKSRNAIRKALKQKKHDPAVKIIVTGCYAQLNLEKIMEMGEIDLVIDNNKKDRIFPAVTSGSIPDFANILKEKDFCEQSTDNMINRSRAIIKVQDGCDYFCAYCAVAYARGPSRSRNPQNIITQVKQLTDKGYKEIILSGINLGLYGYDKSESYYLADLLADLENISALSKIRISSLEPQLFSQDLLDFFRNSNKICPHFHIPLQSGSDELLGKMGRKYKTADFRDTIENLLNIFPLAALGFDVICGLPGETEELFSQTRSFLQELPLAYLHVFPYSRRPGTRAFCMPHQVHGSVSGQRVAALSELSSHKNLAYRQKLIAEETALEAVIEQQKGVFFTGLSDHYVRIHTQSSGIKPGDLIKVQPVSVLGDDLFAEVTG